VQPVAQLALLAVLHGREDRGEVQRRGEAREERIDERGEERARWWDR